jgi:TolA-binding protein
MMNDPTRLLDGEMAGFSRRLLEEARNEQPSGELSARMLVGVSTGVTLGLSGASAKAATHSVAPPALPVGAVTTKSFFGAKVLTALGTGAVVLSAALSGVFPQTQVETTQTEDTKEQDLSLPSPQPAEDSSELSGSRVVDQDAVDLVDNSPKIASVREQPSVRKATDLLKQELSLLESARMRLAEKRPQEALSFLQKYAYRFPQGKLKQEATVLRVEALKAQGETAEASELSKEFLRENPDSAHKPRLVPSSPQE